LLLPARQRPCRLPPAFLHARKERAEGT
jgi:hypothetical protein